MFSLSFTISNRESNRPVMFSRMCRLVSRRWVYRLEVSSKKVSKVCYRVLRVADELRLGLRALEFFTIDVGEYAWDLAVALLVCYDFRFALLDLRQCKQRGRIRESCGLLEL